ncbi:MAG: thiamine diphosphokinase [Pseudomonadota bacterium]|nr:thiamine diphosphokinase [Pseudomonadota bacterium]
MSRFCVLLGGIVTVTARLRQQISGCRSIAADGGMAHAQPLGLAVELWVGDFDSSSPDLESRYRHVERQTFPAAKDRTDGDLAAKAAIARGATSLVLVGALGGQTDHAFAHLTLALRLSRSGCSTMLTSGTEEAHPLLPGRLALTLPIDSRLSLLPLTDLAGLSVGGTRWPLHGIDVELGSTLTLSNTVLGPVEISLASGYGIVIAYPVQEGEPA